MFRRLAVAAAVPLALGILPGSVDPDDQAAADNAVAVFNERMIAAGWTSAGPFTQTASAPEDEEESDFGMCLGGFERYLDYTDVRVEGETARAFSDEFELTSDVDEMDSGYAGAVVLTAEESAVSALDQFVATLGAEDAVQCITDQLGGAEFTEGEATMTIAVTNESPVGVGDASARLDIAVTVDYEGAGFESTATFAAARVDRSLVVILAGGSGSAASELDPVAELEAMVDSFG